MADEEIPIPKLTPALLEARAIRHRDVRALTDPDPRTLNRWKVNYLRQQLARYDPMIEGLFGRVGRADAEQSLRRRVFEAIVKTYPELQDECQRQLRVCERMRE
ncbi:hypothetical protein ACFQ9X_17975 [Catenulispora yoronensis]